MRKLALTLLIGLSVWLAAPARAEMQLVMVEEHGCMWCAAWNAEVGPEYDKTQQGQLAPLRRVDLFGQLPDDIDFDSRLRITPTFVLVVDGHEVRRLEGYPGEDFFWFLLDKMLIEAGANLDDSAG